MPRGLRSRTRRTAAGSNSRRRCRAICSRCSPTSAYGRSRTCAYSRSERSWPMVLWEYAVEILRESIFAYAHACHGNLGTGILAVTFLARLALLPLGLLIARGMARQQQARARLQPALDALRRTHATNATKLAEETQRLFARE